jgi:hypothetical protein
MAASGVVAATTITVEWATVLYSELRVHWTDTQVCALAQCES